MPKFKTLWENYPDAAEMKKRCFDGRKDGEKPFDDFCAILMSECMMRSGIQLDQYNGDKCWSHSGSKYIIRAEELANWLRISPPSGFGKKEEVNPLQFQTRLSGRTGVVFFKDYRQTGKKCSEGSGCDHIDLWRKNRICNASMWYQSITEFIGCVSDLSNSKKIWFWEVQ
jgi:hypothetical protein